MCMCALFPMRATHTHAHTLTQHSHKHKHTHDTHSTHTQHTHTHHLFPTHPCVLPQVQSESCDITLHVCPRTYQLANCTMVLVMYVTTSLYTWYHWYTYYRGYVYQVRTHVSVYVYVYWYLTTPRYHGMVLEYQTSKLELRLY